ncbi:MAG: helix-turn-helix domain-containing protein [Oscillospiraceae bacterium]|nr:helix-turn-helix domain-containing protein [Oscillospiraceae bacterium]
MELLTIKDIQRIYRVGRPTAHLWAERSGAALEREKGQTFRVDKAKLEAWLRRRRTS